MAISFVGSHVGTHNATSAQTVNFTSLLNEAGSNPTLAAGDLVEVTVVHSMATTNNRTLAQLTPSGYTANHAALITANDTNAVAMVVSRKFMTSTPDTSVAIPAAAATTNGVAYTIMVYRGVDQANPLDVTTTTASGTNTGVANCPSVTPVTAGAWISYSAGAAVAAGAVFTRPAGTSASTNHFRTATITTTTNDANVASAIKNDWTSGAYDVAAFGGSTNTNTGSWAAASVVYRPYIPAVFQQKAFRFYDDGVEASATPIAAQNTNINLADQDKVFVLRIMIQETGGRAGLSTDDWNLEYSYNGGAYTSMLTTGDKVRLAVTSNVADGIGTTSRLTGGSGTFSTGRVFKEDPTDQAQLLNYSLPASNYTEFAYYLFLNSGVNGVSDTDTITFRVTLNGNLLDTYTVTPMLTVGIPAGFERVEIYLF